MAKLNIEICYLFSITFFVSKTSYFNFYLEIVTKIIAKINTVITAPKINLEIRLPALIAMMKIIPVVNTFIRYGFKFL